jgi:TM2 domain-containing membrane protein YozV
MKGKVLGFNEATAEGVISGDDGNRYNFARADWKADRLPTNGREVDFVGADGRATEIYVQASALSVSLSSEKSKIVAGLLALFFGGFGLHKFYLGKSKAGIVMLLICLVGFVLLGIPSIIIGVIAFIEAIIYLTKSDADFEEIYVRGNKAWF